MMKKRYEVKGMMEWHPEFRVGRTRLQVSFTGGHLCGGSSSPATYETSDPVVQAIIEGSAYFRIGRIRLDPKFAPKGAPTGCASGAAVRLASACAEPMTVLHDQVIVHKPPLQKGPLTVMEFDSLIKASDFLQEEKGIPVDRVLTPGQCVEEAKSLGIELIIKNSSRT